MRREKAFHLQDSWLIPGMFLILNLFLKFLFIDRMPLGHDEPLSLDRASIADLGELIEVLKGRKHPPLFDLLLHYWIRLFGDSLFAVRALPAIIGSIAVVPFYRIGRDFFNRNVALIIGLLYTFSTLHLHHSHNVRVYTIYVLLCCISMYAFFRCIRKPNDLKFFLIMGVVNAIGLYAHYFMAFVIFLQGASALLFRELWGKFLKRYILTALGTLLLFGPFVWILVREFFRTHERDSFVAEPPDPGALYGQLVKFSNSPMGAVIFISILVLAGGVFLYRAYRENKLELSIELKLLLFWFPGLYLFLFLASQHTPVFIARYLIFVNLGFYLLLAIAWDYLVNKAFTLPQWMRFLLFAGLFLLLILTCEPNQDWYSERGDGRNLIQHLWNASG